MDQVSLELMYDFNFLTHSFNNYVSRLCDHEQVLANSWLMKLKRISETIEEGQLRNDFLYYLAKNCEQGALKAPFREEPPPGPLINLMSLMPGLRPSISKKKSGKKAELFDKSPDKGAFLASQPVPRSGAFCYLAILSRGPNTPPQ